MAGPRTKITDVLDQADLDAQAKRSLSKSGRGLKSRQERNKRDAENAEMRSYKLNRKERF
jgi:hypothetical protein